MSIIEFSKVTKTFGQHKVLNEASFTVPYGSVFGFLGNNGAGKSTTVRLMLGLLKPSDGEIRLFSHPSTIALPKCLNNIGCIIDAPALYQHLTANEYLSLTQRMKNIPKNDIDRVLNIVEMLPHKNGVISEFSLGMKQRLAIANALLGAPDLLVLDEPTNGLDPQGMVDIRELLRSLPKKTGSTIFVSSHLLSEVERIVSHVAIINRGEVVLQDTLKNLVSAEGKLTVSCEQLSNAKTLLSAADFQCSTNLSGELIIGGISKTQCSQIHHLLSKHRIDFWQSTFDQLSLEETFMKICNKQENVKSFDRKRVA
ncbi:ATP-binding cassette domain-containing protein [Glaciecola sp. XM2]|uniref:ABC transporter ATP-binding protein n=1 Tax=Glaciecola sp. XM2 TaxID=1914931 RepID=UPI001BDF0E66|nr:ATP-binding cassette domain-containing protein [Glaciecola sp. XM2]